MGIKNRIKLRLFRYFIYLKKEYKKTYLHKTKVTEYQKKTISVVEMLLRNKDSILMYSTISNKRYIEYKNFLIIFDYDKINIINSHCYDVTLEKEQMLHLIEEFDKEIDRRVRSLELLKRNSLSTALDNLIEEIRIEEQYNL
jgi:hypothetical protein